MTNRDIESRLKNAVQNAVPDVFDHILSECEQQKGTVISMTVKNQKA